MEFRLTYEGELMHRSDANHKHEIRKVFHAQLKRLWQISPDLRNWDSEGQNLVPPHSRIERLGEKFPLDNYRFVPLVTEEFSVVLSLDILMLRAGDPGRVVQHADLDNRLKTLLDALRRPTQRQELGSYLEPEEGERPFFCLMEDDRLVGNISIATDRLLAPPPQEPGYRVQHDCRLIIGVKIQRYSARAFSPFAY